ncbi:MAG: hypothetical protein NT069_19940 [Planctomycetota bacterium]|nr:hypothetical protein [Planctomycetota bacterium]
MLNALWSLLIGLMAWVRACGLAVRSAFDWHVGLSGASGRGAIWLMPDFDASRLDAVSRAIFWGGSGSSPVRVVSDPAPLAAATLRPVEEPVESIWWLGA